jgi:hypothetical protein
MTNRRTVCLLAAALGAGGILAAGLSHGTAPVPPKVPTAEEILKEWQPLLEGGGKEFGTIGGSPKTAPDVAAVSFKLVGLSFGEVWDHYAERCGLEERYKERTFLTKSGAGPKGSYVVSDRPSADGKGRGVTVFLLRAEKYTATVTFHRDPDGKTILGSIAVATR